jgi:hypothetical protein
MVEDELAAGRVGVLLIWRRRGGGWTLDRRSCPHTTSTATS